MDKNQKPSEDPSFKNGRIPIKILNQLNEFTAGGFCLFYFNSESGFPESVNIFDSPICAIAMQKHINDWSTAMQNINIETTTNQIIESWGDDNKENEDEDEED